MRKIEEMWEMAKIEGIADELVLSAEKLYSDPKDQYRYIKITWDVARTMLTKKHRENDIPDPYYHIPEGGKRL